MRFFIHGPIDPTAQSALKQRQHACHTLADLTSDAAVPEGVAEHSAVLLPLLEKHQWNLLTADAGFVREIYEQKTLFGGIIIHILDDPAQPHDQGQAIERLFERYPRLTPRRLYTVTPNRVKIRQLPGGH